MDKLIRYTILATIAGVILAFNLYHADYKLLVAQVGTIVLVVLWLIQYTSSEVEKFSTRQNILRARSRRIFCLARTVSRNPVIWFLAICALSFLLSPHKLASWQELYKVGTWVVFGMIVGSRLSAYGGSFEQYNPEPGEGYYKVGKAGPCPATYSSSEGRAQRGRSREVNDIINVWLAGAGIAALYGILQFFGIDFMKFKLPGGRIVSTFGNATLLAGFLAMTIPVAFALTLTLSPEGRGKGEGVRKLVYGALVFVLLMCLVLTKSRGGLLAAMIGIGTLYILRVRPKYFPRLRSGQASRFHSKNILAESTSLPRAQSRGSRLTRTALVTCIIAGVVLFIIPQVRHVVFEVVLRKTARIYLWKDAIQMVRLQPIFGTGIGTFGLYFPQFVTKGVLEMHPIEWEFVNHAHSEYLEILIEMGILGLIAFLAVIVYVMGKAGPCPVVGQGPALPMGQYRGGLFAAFVTILAHNLVSVDLRYTSTGMFFWMLAGLLYSSSQVEKNMQDSSRLASKSFLRLRSKKIYWLARTIIALAAIFAIYFTVEPYMYVQRVEEQEFFSKDRDELDRRIAESTDYFSLGVLHAKKQDFRTAKRYFIEAIKKDPRHAGAFNNLGNIAFMQGDAGRARALFHKALRVEPDNVDYLVNFGYACFKVNVMDQAMWAVEKALRLSPENARARLLRRQMTQ